MTGYTCSGNLFSTGQTLNFDKHDDINHKVFFSSNQDYWISSSVSSCGREGENAVLPSRWVSKEREKREGEETVSVDTVELSW